MKRTLSTILASTMALSLFASMPAFADGDETTQPPQPTYLFSADFDGENPLKDFYGATATEANKESMPYNSANISVTTDTGWNSNYLNIIPTDQSHGYAKLFLGKNVEKTGKLVIEYDDQMMLELAANSWGAKNAARGLAIQRVNPNREFVEEVSDNDLKLKNLVDYRGSNRQKVDGFDRANYVLKENATNIYDGEVKSGFLTKYNSAEPLLREREQWEHCKLVIDFTTGEYQLFVNGALSEKYKEKEGYTKIIKGSDYFDSIVIWALKNGANKYAPWKLDNIKVYKVGDNNSAFVDTDSITQDSETGVVTAKFKYAMDSTPIKLYDADGNDVTKLVTMSEDKKTATIKPNTNAMQGVYYVKVGNYDGVNYGPAEKEQTVELNYAGEPNAYLFKEDFESYAVGSVPENGFYKNESKNYSATDKTSITSDYATVAKDEDGTNTTNYLNFDPKNSSSKQIKFYLDKYYSSGVMVLEYDAHTSTNNNGNNGGKVINLGTEGANWDKKADGSSDYSKWTHNGNRSSLYIMGYQGSNVTADLKKTDYGTENVTNVMLKKVLWQPSGTDKAGDYNKWIENSTTDKLMLRKDNEWNHYKLEMNLKNGQVTLWLNGQISETWESRHLLYNVGGGQWGKQEMDSFILESNFADGTYNQTPFKLDNIKVYLKDTADTSPFESITSEKNGNVVAKFGYAIKAEDLSVYNADGKKINGTFTVAEDNKTATFVPARIEDDGLYYVQVAKLASGKVTPQTTKEFNYAPGRTKMVISDLNAVSGDVAPKFTLTHTDGEAKDVVMIVAAYKDGKMVKADVKTKPLTNEEINGVVESAPTLTLTDGEADTVKAFAWIGGTFVPIGQSAVYTTLGE